MVDKIDREILESLTNGTDTVTQIAWDNCLSEYMVRKRLGIMLKSHLVRYVKHGNTKKWSTTFLFHNKHSRKTIVVKKSVNRTKAHNDACLRLCAGLLDNISRNGFVYIEAGDHNHRNMNDVVSSFIKSERKRK